MMKNTEALSHKPLRVLMISEFPYKGIVVGGVQSAVKVLATALSQLPEIEKVLVLSFRVDIDEDILIKENEKLTVHHVPGQRRFSLPTHSFFDLRRAKKIAGEFRPDIVHGQGTGGSGDIAIRLGYPSLVTIHGVGIFDTQLRERNNKIIGPVRVWLTKRMVNRVVQCANVIISISEFDREYCSGIRNSHVVGIPNAVRPEFFDTEPTFPEVNRINYSGVIIIRKDVVGIVRAFHKVKQQVPNAVLDIAGPATDNGYYQEVLNNIDPAVKKDIVFHGNLKGPELAYLMKGASVCVLFSIYENLPVVIAEALSLGKPVVASRVGAVAEMVHDGVNGFLVESGDEGALAERLIRLLTDPQLRKSMGMKARELALQRWKPDRVAKETLRAYRLAREEYAAVHYLSQLTKENDHDNSKETQNG